MEWRKPIGNTILAIVILVVLISSTSCPEVVESLLRVAQPTFTPVGGTSDDEPIDVAISCATEGATIRYTIDGEDPSSTSGTIYTEPVRVASTTTIKAIAYMEGMLDSLVGTATYTIGGGRVEEPVFRPMIGMLYNEPVDVSMVCPTDGASIRYTTDGSDPTPTSGTVYSDPVRITTTTTFKAIAYKEGMTASPIGTGTYTVNLPKVKTPVFSSKTPGSFGSHTYITLATATEGATILYTLDESEPEKDNENALEYSDRFSIYNTHTIKAKAYKDGMQDSDTLSGKFWPTKVDEPDYSPLGGTQRESIDVEISTETIGATIAYKVNDEDWTEYDEPIELDTEGEYYFQAQATLSGLENSDVAYEDYTLDWLPADPPQFNPGAGNFNGEVMVTISSTSPGAKIRYTYDGSDPTPTHGTEYTGPINVTSSALIKAVAYGDELDPTTNNAGYKIIGPAGGFVVLDKGETSAQTLVIVENGLMKSSVHTTKSWRYIEVAPVDFSATLSGSWAEGLTADPVLNMYPNDSSYEERHVEGTLHNIGCGWENSNLLLNAFADKEDPFGAKACADFTSHVGANSYSDWFLPSKEELQLISQRLGDDGLKLMDGIFLSSTLDLDNGLTYEGYWRVKVGTGTADWDDNRTLYGGKYVRPIRMY